MILDDNNIIVNNKNIFYKGSKIKAIYYIYNSLNNKYYIGSTTNAYERYVSHKSKLNLNKHHSDHLQNAYNFYGAFVFKFGILELLESSTSIEEKEQYWIEKFKSYNKEFGYNLRKIAINNSGYKWSENSKLKLSKSKTGKPRSEQTKEKLRIANIGRKQTLETCIKRSIAMQGRKQTKEHIAKRFASRKLNNATR